MPPQAAEERMLERWMKISLAHLADNTIEATITPIILMSVEISEILPNESTESLRPIIHALLDIDHMEKIKSENRFTKKNHLLFKYLEQYDSKNVERQLTKIHIEFSADQITALLKISENFLKLIKNATEQNKAFILDCKSLGISDTKIDACSNKYEALLTKEVNKIAQQAIASVLSGGKITHQLPALPDIPAKPVGVKIIEDRGCCPSILHAFGLKQKQLYILEAHNNMPDEEHKEEFKPQRINI